MRRSAHVLRARPLEAHCEWTRIGGQQRIVTYTRLRVDEPLAGAPEEAELLVRTLGGTVGKLGQIVHGEAELLIGEECVTFLMQTGDGVLGVTAMAQGHYPLASDEGGVVRLRPSGQLSVLVGDKASAVARLRGKSVLEARDLVKEAAKP